MPAGVYTWGSGNPVRITAGTVIHAADILQMRTNLDDAWFNLFSQHLTFTNAPIAAVKYPHIADQ
jgi:hypothetical protein